ncbi:DUF2459 domain-containing protein [Cohaesibacter gelatinilyticus]|uniref:DUF2459 domain-containing protein n=1 Tax=Cohaesibacter gelatinilyticus TaxID=372072 RepID=A0A285NJI4_9HYPH|nr:DUF2459 domain-containing protein [Cohaesibacter gelatinilyticus]SNZ08026.1 conserved hypothetical protein [Cohaesibacter gelatinilyticus]
MIRRIFKAGLILICLTVAMLFKGERSANSKLYPASNPEAQATIYVTDLGYHAGIVVPAYSIKHMPELINLNKTLSYFEGADWLEIGWGDKAFYEAGEWDLINLPTMAKAAFIPTPTTFHMAGFRGHIPSIFKYDNVVELVISKAGLAQMLQGIDSDMKFPLNDIASKGLYGDSRFFPARGHYHLFSICNHWTAKRLNDAGLPVNITLATWPGLLRYDLVHRSSAKNWPAKPYPNNRSEQ